MAVKQQPIKTRSEITGVDSVVVKVRWGGSLPAENAKIKIRFCFSLPDLCVLRQCFQRRSALTELHLDKDCLSERCGGGRTSVNSACE
jgi:hypothetical protein